MMTTASAYGIILSVLLVSVSLSNSAPPKRGRNDNHLSPSIEQIEAPNYKKSGKARETRRLITTQSTLDKQENKLTESSEPIYSDPAEDFASSTHEEDEDEEADDIDTQALRKNKKKVVDIGRHIKLQKNGRIGGKIICDHHGCHPVDFSSSNESSL